MLKEPKRIIAEEPLSPDSRDTGTGLFSQYKMRVKCYKKVAEMTVICYNIGVDY